MADVIEIDEHTWRFEDGFAEIYMHLTMNTLFRRITPRRLRKRGSRFTMARCNMKW